MGSAYTERYMLTPQLNGAGYNASSLLQQADSFLSADDADLMLIHGTADDNVHFINSALLSEALVARGFPLRTQWYTNSNHGLSYDGAWPHAVHTIKNFFMDCFDSHGSGSGDD